MLDPTIKEVGAKLDTNFDTIMSSMNELFNYYQNKFRLRNIYSNVKQTLTSHRNLAHVLLLKGKGIAYSIRNELQMYCSASLEVLVTPFLSTYTIHYGSWSSL